MIGRMDSGTCAENIWPTVFQAAMFLKYVGLLALPSYCGRQHQAKHLKLECNEGKGLCRTHCFHRGPPQARPEQDAREGGPAGRGKVCNLKRSWRGSARARMYCKAKARQQQRGVAGPLPMVAEIPLCPLAAMLPMSLRPTQLMKAIHWFWQKVPLEQARHETGHGIRSARVHRRHWFAWRVSFSVPFSVFDTLICIILVY